MKIIFLILFFFFLTLINSKIKRRTCGYGNHYRMFKQGTNYYKRFHECICPKLKNCKKIKKCKFGVPYQPLNNHLCKDCFTCRKEKCPKLEKVENCLKYETFYKNGCKSHSCSKCKKLNCKFGTYTNCRRRFPPIHCDECPKCKSKPKCPTYKELNCKTCEFGVDKYNRFEGCEACPTCNPKPKNCPKLTCKQLNCTLGFETHKDWKGCELCPFCNCPPLKFSRCEFGDSYFEKNKDGCDILKCRETECPKVLEPKNCDNLWWDYKVGCKTTPHCWINPCKNLKCPKVDCKYGIFAPRDPKTGCWKCEYCEKDPRVKVPDEMDIQLQEIEKIIDMI